jgi:hemoglobin-like flavoprotein
VTPDAIAAVRKTSELASADNRFGPSFYRHLFSAHPSTRSLFSASIEEQERKFTEQLAAIMRSLDDFTAFSAEARALGAKHTEHGVLPSHYAAVCDALIDALVEVLGELDDETEAAWRAAIDLLAEEMQATS